MLIIKEKIVPSSRFERLTCRLGDVNSMIFLIKKE